MVGSITQNILLWFMDEVASRKRVCSMPVTCLVVLCRLSPTPSDDFPQNIAPKTMYCPPDYWPQQYCPPDYCPQNIVPQTITPETIAIQTIISWYYWLPDYCPQTIATQILLLKDYLLPPTIAPEIIAPPPGEYCPPRRFECNWYISLLVFQDQIPTDHYMLWMWIYIQLQSDFLEN